MKKVLISGLLLTFACVNAAETLKGSKKNLNSLVSIDSIVLMQDSKEGKLLAEKFQAEIEDFRIQVKAKQEELVEFQTKIEKQAKVLSKEAKIEKVEELEKMKKDAERVLADKEESLKTRVQRQQFALRDKQMKVINDVCKQEGWGALIDKNLPGVLFVNNAIDQTEKMLKAVDEKYSQDISPAKDTESLSKNA